ncbi:MAG: formate dehydrogenase accessory sulfurtransferase FdhD [Deltaproteobacteria bacterium]|nr:formate dehydrogenase accessory sulfurtransferase FdhD [Deltaproteobacteria bacterium]
MAGREHIWTGPEHNQVDCALVSSEALRQVPAHRVATDGSASEAVAESVPVVVESAVTIDVDGVDSFTLLCTPGDAPALAAGFLLGEGIIDEAGDIAAIRPCADDPAVVRVKLRRGAERIGDQSRNLLVASSCGLCGAGALDHRLAALPRVADTLRISRAVLRRAGEALRQRQFLFDACGGTHAAGIFDAKGELRQWAEDTGRHHALDKAIGKCLLAGVPTAGCGAVLSGRASIELVAKCARAGIELLATVSAPTSLAVEVAERCNITLCAFVRETRATIFSHQRRVTS